MDSFPRVGSFETVTSDGLAKILAKKLGDTAMAVIAKKAEIFDANGNVREEKLPKAVFQDFTGTGTDEDPYVLDPEVFSRVLRDLMMSLPGYVGDGSKQLYDNFTWK